MAKKRGFDFLRFIRTIGAIFGMLISLMIFTFVLLIFVSTISWFVGEPLTLTGNVAHIPIKGPISTSSMSSIMSPTGTKSSTIVKWIQDAEKNDNIKAIWLDIDSPGGTPVGTVEIADAVKKAKKPTIAVIHELGNSGAYWIASSADTIFANRLSTVGSIGVRSSYLEFSGLLTDYNVTYERLVAGKFKDMTTPYKQMTPEERTLIQSKLDRLHEIFINEVARNRKLDVDHVQKLANGYVYMGFEAEELGLIDELGTTEDAKQFLEKELNLTVSFKKFQEKTGFFEAVIETMNDASYKIGQGMGSVMLGSTEYEVDFSF
ncbi:signal peptide peptidase SppA [Candidatus Woesearchaeota archaeon]|nr:signal peptide peptidase SppA [Candidatus Woesearchaeota archaeon]MBW2994658.1 signal peptide peptidase SppA [Candidatus Woesearchaeota archaeon]